jgi:hypothetical protein
MRKVDRKYVATHFVNIILSTCTSVSLVLEASKRGTQETVKSILEKILMAIQDQEIPSVKAIDPDLQGMKEKESSNGHDIGTFAIFHIVNHNIRSER